MDTPKAFCQQHRQWLLPTAQAVAQLLGNAGFCKPTHPTIPRIVVWRSMICVISQFAQRNACESQSSPSASMQE